jgi:hypothetical protein
MCIYKAVRRTQDMCYRKRMEGLATNIVWEADNPANVTANVAEAPMLWAENQETTKEVDQAHCLMGILDIHLPAIYGEGQNNALKWLQEVIDK